MEEVILVQKLVLLLWAKVTFSWYSLRWLALSLGLAWGDGARTGMIKGIK